ncbi:MAG TPA: YihY/virulence factor BrkB family protein [Gaiellaceae bacterium]|nr:YihY/virulence factor BrkB family protein [Gaiellaceae bacterium]
MKARLKRFVQLWVDLLDRHLLLDHASAIAFNVLKALVPLTLLGLAVLGAAGKHEVWQQTLFPRLQQHLQPTTAHAINAAVERIFSTDSTGLIALATLMVVWYVSGSVRAVMGSMNDIYDTEETRSWKARYPLSFGLALVIAICLVGSLLVVTASVALAQHGVAGVAVAIGRWLVAIGLLALGVAVLVRYAPAERRAKKWASAGSILVIVAWIGATLLFDLFVTHVANFKTAVGSLTVFLVLIGYVYTSSIIFLVGVELDELLREDAAADERGVLELLGIAR